MIDIWTIAGGDMWRQAMNGMVTILGTSTYTSLLRIVGTFAVLGGAYTFIRHRDPMKVLSWLGVFVLLNSILLVPKRSVQIHDMTDSAAVYVVDNVPVGLAVIASLTTSVGYGVAQMFDYTLSRPDSLTYTKTGMLYGSGIVSQTIDFQTQNPQLASMLPDYVKGCVIGDIMLNGKYTVSQLLNSPDPLTLITDNPSPLRGLYREAGIRREFATCMQVAAEMKMSMNIDMGAGGMTMVALAQKLFGNRVNAQQLLAQAMADSYGYFYSGSRSASQIMRANVVNQAVRQGWKGFSAGANDTANLVNLASESAMTKQRLSWAAGQTIAVRTLPLFQSIMMLILICLFPLMVALALSNHEVFGLTTLKIYIGGFLYFQMWPVMFAILNFAANFYLKTGSGDTALVLANTDQVKLQHSDIANIAGYLCMSIPVLAFYLTKGAMAVGSQAVSSVLSSASFTAGGQASTAADGNWSFSNMSTDNLNQNKSDTNFSIRAGQQTQQLGNAASHTMTSDGHNVYDTSGATSNLPVNMRLSSLVSSGLQEQSRQAEQQAHTSLQGYNHSVTSGAQQLAQFSRQSGNSDSVTQGSDSSQATNATRGMSQMQSAVDSWAKSHNVSQQEAYNQLMDISNQGSMGAGARGYVKFDSGDQIVGKVGKWATGLSAGGEANVNTDWRHSSGSSHGTQDSHAQSRDNRHDENSQAVRDFREGMDKVSSSRVSESGNHTDNQSASQVTQFAATLADSKSQYQQFTDSSTKSQEFSRMATMSQTQSASLDANYSQAFVDWSTARYGSEAQGILTNTSNPEPARQAAMEFMREKMTPEIMSQYGENTQAVKGAPASAGAGGQMVASPASGEGVQRHGQDGVPQRDIQSDFERNRQQAGEQANGAGIMNNVKEQAAEQRSVNEGNIRENSGKIEENRSTVQTSSDKLKAEHGAAVLDNNIKRAEEDLDQRQPVYDGQERSDIKEKLRKLRSGE